MGQVALRRVLLGVGGFLFVAGLVGMAWTAWLLWSPLPAQTAAPVLPTSTPFLPQQPTATLPAPSLTPPPTEIPTEIPTEAVVYDEFRQLREGDTGVVKIAMEPPQQVNGGRTIKLAFIPAGDCAYGTGRACVSTHRGGQVTLLTIHSGLGGEGENFRSAVEGTGLNMAFFSLARIRRNLEALSGAPVLLTIGDAGRDDLLLGVVVRIPPAGLQAYFSQPFDEVLEIAAQDDPALQNLLDEGNDLLAFEICGWQLPGEPWAEGVTPTTGSMYLGFIKVR